MPITFHGDQDKENKVYTCSRLLFSLKNNEILPYATARMKLENMMLSEMSQFPNKDYRITLTVKFTEAERRSLVAKIVLGRG